MPEAAHMFDHVHSPARLAALALLSSTLTACATVRQDEVGVKRTLGRIAQKPVTPGAQFIAPGFQSVLRVPVRTVNREVRLDLPTKEGLNVGADVSILYRIKPEMAPRVLEQSGMAYEEVIILPVFRSASADVSARFMAKDLHSGERATIERAIQQQMTQALDARGFVVENVLLKSIRLPAGLAQAVEQKLEAEQRAQQMRFVLETERQEADRKRVEAEGIRDAQKIIGEGLTPTVLQYQSIQAMRELAASPNAKLVMTDGKTPFLLTPADNTSVVAQPIVPAPAPRRSGTNLPR
jgi:regulator of protease activity HflC (stomatin/prohibitin superfamily)